MNTPATTPYQPLESKIVDPIDLKHKRPLTEISQAQAGTNPPVYPRFFCTQSQTALECGAPLRFRFILGFQDFQSQFYDQCPNLYRQSDIASCDVVESTLLFGIRDPKI